MCIQCTSLSPIDCLSCASSVNVRGREYVTCTHSQPIHTHRKRSVQGCVSSWQLTFNDNHAHAQTRTHAHTRARARAHTHTHTLTRAHTHTYTHTHTHSHQALFSGCGS